MPKLKNSEVDLVPSDAGPLDESDDAGVQKTPKAKKVKRVRRVFQCGDPLTAPSQLALYTSPPRVDANGFKYGPVAKVLTRNAAFQFVLAADASLYDEQLQKLRDYAEASGGKIQEVSLDAENKVPEDMAEKTPEQLTQDLQRIKAEKSNLDLKLGKMIDEAGEQNAEVEQIRLENERLKKLVEDLSK